MKARIALAVAAVGALAVVVAAVALPGLVEHGVAASFARAAGGRGTHGPIRYEVLHDRVTVAAGHLPLENGAIFGFREARLRPSLRMLLGIAGGGVPVTFEGTSLDWAVLGTGLHATADRLIVTGVGATSGPATLAAWSVRADERMAGGAVATLSAHAVFASGRHGPAAAGGEPSLRWTSSRFDGLAIAKDGASLGTAGRLVFDHPDREDSSCALSDVVSAVRPRANPGLPAPVFDFSFSAHFDPAKHTLLLRDVAFVLRDEGSLVGDATIGDVDPPDEGASAAKAAEAARRAMTRATLVRAEVLLRDGGLYGRLLAIESARTGAPTAAIEDALTSPALREAHPLLGGIYAALRRSRAARITMDPPQRLSVLGLAAAARAAADSAASDRGSAPDPGIRDLGIRVVDPGAAAP